EVPAKEQTSEKQSTSTSKNEIPAKEQSKSPLNAISETTTQEN
ncbi:7993_t:CDS:1, partial [Racocetra fulgida]